jgi:glycosyltransferase involved in cell wall biosynthesis
VISDLLTIVVPTRDRPDLLELCLRSVFGGQIRKPRVVVSDNSTREWAALNELRHKYDFDYHRQSGDLQVVEHHNRCMQLPRTEWVMLLHDDDELYPDALERLDPLLTENREVALVVGGLDYIDAAGSTLEEWMPAVAETVRGDDAILRVGLDFHLRSPNTIFRVASIRESGGYHSANEAAYDYELYSRLSFVHGVSFLPIRLGRYRLGHEQYTNVATPDRTELHLRQSVGAAASIRAVGCRPETIDCLVDQMAWGLFLSHAARWRDSDPGFVCRLFDICRQISHWPGPMRARVQQEYPLLFWRPRILAEFMYKRVERLGYRVTRPDRHYLHQPGSIWKDYSTGKTSTSGTSKPK